MNLRLAKEEVSRRSDRKGRQHGYTLVETMIVAGLIAVLAGIALPSYRSSMDRQAGMNDAVTKSYNDAKKSLLDEGRPVVDTRSPAPSTPNR